MGYNSIFSSTDNTEQWCQPLMPDLIHQFIGDSAARSPDALALQFKDQAVTYAQLQTHIDTVAAGLINLGIGPGERVATYLPKQLENVYGIFGAAAAGACFVPVNPLLKPRQLNHILPHCQVKVLFTSAQRLLQVQDVIAQCRELHTIVLVDEMSGDATLTCPQKVIPYSDFCNVERPAQVHRRIDTDMTAILYTSGSTGNPKGVVLSHRNMVAGAQSVANYIENTEADRILAVLPLSFDAGLSQLTTAFSVGACVVLMDYLLPRDVIRAVVKHQITGLTAVPPLWNQLRPLEWPAEAAKSLRYIANTGGAMPVATTHALQKMLPNTSVFLMYGLTEAFRSTYLPPDQVAMRPESMGKAIPNAEVLVINEHGNECAPNEPGELVHRGALVSLGYWNDPEKTAARFKPCPTRPNEIPTLELAVWSGDQVMKDEEGYLYFISRQDDMIKTSGYRVSPTEVEESVFSSGLVSGAVALGLPHPSIGQAILLVITGNETSLKEEEAFSKAVQSHCRKELPNFMQPLAIVARETLPHNQNGKIDRRALTQDYDTFFQEEAS